jgi:hypothetical protein
LDEAQTRALVADAYAGWQRLDAEAHERRRRGNLIGQWYCKIRLPTEGRKVNVKTRLYGRPLLTSQSLFCFVSTSRGAHPKREAGRQCGWTSKSCAGTTEPWDSRSDAPCALGPTAAN